MKRLNKRLEKIETELHNEQKIGTLASEHASTQLNEIARVGTSCAHSFIHSFIQHYCSIHSIGIQSQRPDPT